MATRTFHNITNSQYLLWKLEPVSWALPSMWVWLRACGDLKGTFPQVAQPECLVLQHQTASCRAGGVGRIGREKGGGVTWGAGDTGGSTGTGGVWGWRQCVSDCTGWDRTDTANHRTATTHRIGDFCIKKHTQSLKCIEKDKKWVFGKGFKKQPTNDITVRENKFNSKKINLNILHGTLACTMHLYYICNF